MARSYVCVRLWPWFGAGFPYERFNALDDGAIVEALDRYAGDEFQKHRDVVREKLRMTKAAMERRLRAGTLPSRPRLPKSVAVAAGVNRRLAPKHLPLYARYGSLLGWCSPGLGDVGVSDRRVLAFADESEEAGATASALQKHFDRLVKRLEPAVEPVLWRDLNPRFFVLSPQGRREEAAIEMETRLAEKSGTQRDILWYFLGITARAARAALGDESPSEEATSESAKPSAAAKAAAPRGKPAAKPEKPIDLWLSSPDLARRHGVDARILDARLARWRKPENSEFWEDIGDPESGKNRRRGQARYTYLESAVLPIIRAIQVKDGGGK